MRRYTQSLNQDILPSKYGEWVRTADVNTILNDLIREHIADRRSAEHTLLKWEVVAGVLTGISVALVGALL